MPAYKLAIFDWDGTLMDSVAHIVDSIYSGGRLNFEIRRTRSRLQEMQSQEYLELPHLP